MYKKNPPAMFLPRKFDKHFQLFIYRVFLRSTQYRARTKLRLNVQFQKVNQNM